MLNQVAKLHYKHNLGEKEIHIQVVQLIVSLRTVVVTADVHVLLDNASETQNMCIIDTLKAKRVCFVQEIGAYRAVNTIDRGYTKPDC